MSLARLTELAKKSIESPMYYKTLLEMWFWSDLKLHMSQALWNWFVKTFPPAGGLDQYYNIEYGIPVALFGIRVIIDHGLENEPLVWILVDPAGEELERGTIEPEQTMHSGELR